ncbi:hypothetical protein BD408DRAFT_238397 [Parasitella parasitica]|nr:hypothetical protein BD408DRAFT_238397 [Parasitella parasitica]
MPWNLSSYSRNVIYTDGYSVSFLFSRITAKKKKGSLPVKPSDLKTDIDNGCQVWAVDSGISTVFTIVDQAGRVGSLGQKEYYHLCGFNDAAHIRKIHQAKHTNTHRMITELDSLKTGEVSKFLIACRKRIYNPTIQCMNFITEAFGKCSKLLYIF